VCQNEEEKQSKKNILILADMEGIIGVSDMNEEETNIKLMQNEILITVEELNRLGSAYISVCCIHNNGTGIQLNGVLSLGVTLIVGIDNLAKEIENYSYAIMLGFHGKRNSGGAFDHTFRSDILTVHFGTESIGEVGAYYRWLELEGVVVLFVSGEGCFYDELTRKICAVHYTSSDNLTNIENLFSEYDRFRGLLRANLCNSFYVSNNNYNIPNEMVFVRLSNPDTYLLLQEECKFKVKDDCVVFDSISEFFHKLISFCTSLNIAAEKIIRKNIKLISEILYMGYSCEEMYIMLKSFGEMAIQNISSAERTQMARVVGLNYEYL